MLDFDAGKLVVIGVVALVVIGPKDLPRVLRTVGQTVAKLRRMAADFQGQFMDAMREAEMADVKEEMHKIADSAKIDVAFDPVRDIRNQISGAVAGETTVQAMPTEALAPPDSPASGIDLSHVGEATASTAEGGLVATGIAPGTETSAEPATPATLDDVRHALGKELGAGTGEGAGQKSGHDDADRRHEDSAAAADVRPPESRPVKEPTA